MKKAARLDYILYNSKHERIVFRFYPRNSACYSFSEEPPRTWSDVYQVAYSWAILRQTRDSVKKPWKSKYLFSCSFDEGSVLGYVGCALVDLSNGLTSRMVYDHAMRKWESWQHLDRPIQPFGDGVTWIIRKRLNYTKWYVLELWDWKNQGYRFALSLRQLGKFGKFLQDCCEYMLAHSDGEQTEYYSVD